MSKRKYKKTNRFVCNLYVSCLRQDNNIQYILEYSKKAIKSLDKRIDEHKEKQKAAKFPELHHYYEMEISKFEKEKKKKQKWL